MMAGPGEGWKTPGWPPTWSTLDCPIYHVERQRYQRCVVTNSQSLNPANILRSSLQQV